MSENLETTKYKYLVTGCGGDIALSIGKILKSINPENEVYGCDISDDHPGFILYDQCFLIPRANDKDYLQTLKDIVLQYNISIVIPSSEAELEYIISNEINETDIGAILIMPNTQAIKIGLDKYATFNFFQESGLDSPWTQLPSAGLPQKLPCIFKKRIDAGSKSVIICEDVELAEYLLKKGDNYIWQELLLPPDEEYTCGLYRSINEEIRSVIIKRRLIGGLTGSGIICHNMEITTLLNKIAQKINLIGSINVQLRMTERGPLVFEINPRFSSTVYFRHLLGFCDLQWAIEDVIFGRISSYNDIEGEPRIYRTANEIIKKDS